MAWETLKRDLQNKIRNHIEDRHCTGEEEEMILKERKSRGDRAIGYHIAQLER